MIAVHYNNDLLSSLGAIARRKRAANTADHKMIQLVNTVSTVVTTVVEFACISIFAAM